MDFSNPLKTIIKTEQLPSPLLVGTNLRDPYLNLKKYFNTFLPLDILTQILYNVITL